MSGRDQGLAVAALLVFLSHDLEEAWRVQDASLPNTLTAGAAMIPVFAGAGRAVARAVCRRS